MIGISVSSAGMRYTKLGLVANNYDMNHLSIVHSRKMPVLVSKPRTMSDGPGRAQ